MKEKQGKDLFSQDQMLVAKDFLNHQDLAVVLNYNTGISGGVNSAGQRIVFGHATVVTRVRIFDNGRFIINVMNPGGSTTKFTNVKSFHLIFGVY